MTAPTTTAASPWGGRAAARPAEAPAGARTLDTDFEGSRWRLLWLALKMALATVLTLGVYRFWMRTRLRRWYWSAVRPGGHALEYTGDAVEKLLGFLIAVVVLAFYLAVVNLGLMFASLAILEDHVLPTLLTSLGLVPMIFYARYRARRYVLARTRWRGIRFGLEPGAFGYAGRALWHWALTLLTLGILWPRMTFWLEKYRTDRTTFGDARLHQGGRWQMLLPPAILPWVGVVVAGLGAVGSLVALGDLPLGPAGDALGGVADRRPWLGPAMAAGGLLVALIGAIRYSVRSFALMAGAKTLSTPAGAVGLSAEPRPARVVGIVLSGYALLGVVMVLVMALMGAGLFGLLSVLEIDAEADPLAALSSGWVVAAGVVVNVTFFLVWGACKQTLVDVPVLRHYALTLSVAGPEALSAVRQSARDEATEAGGFAEALDLGAAI